MKKKIATILTLALAMVMSLSILAACGSKDNKHFQEETTFVLDIEASEMSIDMGVITLPLFAEGTQIVFKTDGTCISSIVFDTTTKTLLAGYGVTLEDEDFDRTYRLEGEDKLIMIDEEAEEEDEKEQEYTITTDDDGKMVITAEMPYDENTTFTIVYRQV